MSIYSGKLHRKVQHLKDFILPNTTDHTLLVLDNLIPYLGIIC